MSFDVKYFRIFVSLFFRSILCTLIYLYKKLLNESEREREREINDLSLYLMSERELLNEREREREIAIICYTF